MLFTSVAIYVISIWLFLFKSLANYMQVDDKLFKFIAHHANRMNARTGRGDVSHSDLNLQR